MLIRVMMLLFAIACSCTASAVPFRLPGQQEVQDWLRTRMPSHEGLRQKVTQTDEEYEIVFVPGILGSELRIGQFVYGKDPIDPARLVFAANQAVGTGTLNEFRAHVVKRVFRRDLDIYGQGLNSLQAANGGRVPIEFSYDWRDDLDKLAGQFDKFLAARAKDKKIVIVAHSMGGVVAWHWKNKFKSSAARNNLIALMTLGSPLRGSCEPVRMIVEGYGPPDTTSSFEKWATHLVFGKAHPAILTFPSVFALLPAYDPQKPCLKIRRGTTEQPLDHHEAGAWLGRAGGDYELDPAFAAKVQLDPLVYRQRVENAVRAGRAFRRAFDSNPFDDQIYLFFSEGYRLSASTVVAPKGTNWLVRVKADDNTPGDGRVPRDSAINGGNFDARRGGSYPLDREHGELLADPRFSSFVQVNITNLIGNAKQSEILAFAAKDPVLRRELLDRKWIADASLASTPVARIGTINSAINTLIDYNTELMAENANSPELQTVNFAQADRAKVFVQAGTAILSLGDEYSAAALYSTAVAVDPAKVDATAYQQLGRIRFKQGRLPESVDSSIRAGEAARADPKLPIEIRSAIHHQIVAALSANGARDEAMKAQQVAAKFGRETPFAWSPLPATTPPAFGSFQAVSDVNREAGLWFLHGPLDRQPGTPLDRPMASAVDRPGGTAVDRPWGTAVDRPRGTAVDRPGGTAVDGPPRTRGRAGAAR